MKYNPVNEAHSMLQRAILIFLCLSTFVFNTQQLSGIEVEMFISLVNVWVKAVDSSGQPVRDLKQEDFEVYEDGVKMTLDCFEQRTTDITKEPVNTADPPKFVIFLDLLNTKAGDLIFIKPKLFEFLDQMAPLSYEVMVVALLPNGRLGIVRPFTRNTTQVKSTLEQAKGNSALAGDTRNNEAQIRSLLDRLEPEPNPVMSIEDLASSGGSPLRERNTQRLRAAYNLASEFSKQEKSRGEVILRALESMGTYLAGKSEGAHTIVLYISGGFSSQPGHHYYEFIEEVAERKGFIFDRQVFAMRVGVQQPERFDIETMVRNTLGKLNRMNVTLYSIGTGGMATIADASSTGVHPDSKSNQLTVESALQDSLRRVANQTGGLSFVNSQNFKVGFDRIVTDLAHNYLVCYKPPEHKSPKYHEIKVVCKKPGVNLRHRQGYYD